jgi:hypothetical protein
MSLPASRAERFKFLLDKMRCPSQRYTSILYPSGLSACPDQGALARQKPWPAVSYLMPVHFQYFGQDYAETIIGYMESDKVNAPVYARTAPGSWEIQEDDYLPMINRVGTPARKIFAAGGTRYLPASQLLDHDPNPLPTLFGSFSSAGGWWSGSTAYGVGAGTFNWGGWRVGDSSPSDGRNLALSYRHGIQDGVPSGDCHDNKGKTEALFFDGHARPLTDRQSREIYYWYPSGAKVKAPTEGMTKPPEELIVP